MDTRSTNNTPKWWLPFGQSVVLLAASPVGGFRPLTQDDTGPACARWEESGEEVDNHCDSDLLSKISFVRSMPKPTAYE